MVQINTNKSAEQQIASFVPWRFFLLSLLASLVFLIVAFTVLMPRIENMSIESKEKSLQELTSVVFTQFELLHDLVEAGAMTEQQAKNTARKFVRSIRYGKRHRSYFWIHNLSGQFVVHPYRRDLEGLAPDRLDEHTRKLVARMNKMIEERGSGFISYSWQWNDSRDRLAAKKSFIKLFKPWRWVVGTGLYLDEVKKDVAEFRDIILLTITAVFVLFLLLGMSSTIFAYRSEKAKALALKKSRELESQLRQSQKMETLGTLAGGIAHDFNNILTAIIGFTQVAMDRAKDDVRKDLKEVLTASDRAKDLVQQMLAFSRKVDHEIRVVDLRDLLMESVRMMKASAPADIRIVRDIPGQSIRVLADPVHIQQVLLNLFTNACDAMKSGGTVTVYLGLKEDPKDDWNNYPDLAGKELCELSLSDSGKGMEQAVLDRIFDPFYTTKDVNRGTGLGLSVVHGIVTSMGGHIYVVSSPGKGSTFRIILPTSQDSVDISPVNKIKGSVYGTERVMLVDDDMQVANVQRRLLINMGYSVLSQMDPIAALEHIKSDPGGFDVLVTDNIMPLMTGVQLAKEALKVNPGLKVVLVTGRPGRLTADGEIKTIISKVLLKPVLATELAGAIREVVEKES